MSALADGHAFATISVGQLRDRVGLDRATFDRTINRMLDRGILDGHKYDHPAGLSQAEKDRLVYAGKGRIAGDTNASKGSDQYYVGVSIREGHEDAIRRRAGKKK